MDLGDELTQNKYINKLQNGKAIMKIAVRERASHSQADQKNTRKELSSHISVHFTINVKDLLPFLALTLS